MSLFATKQPTVKDFYNEHKDEILKLVASEHVQNKDISHLKYELTVKSGRRYYSFPEKGKIPFIRLSKGIEIMDWLRNGINPEEFDKIYEALDECFAHIRAKTGREIEFAKKGGLLTAELKRRRLQALPYYVLINLCANYLIREDEDPNFISTTINHEKCDEIQAEIESGNSAFFFSLPQLRPLSIVTRLSLPELNDYLMELKTEAEKDHQYLKAYLSWIETRKDKKTSLKLSTSPVTETPLKPKK